MLYDGAFSIDAGLELLGVAGLVRRAGLMYNLQPAHKGWSCDLHQKGNLVGVFRPPLQCLNPFFLMKRKEINC